MDLEAFRQLKAFFGDVAEPGHCDRCTEERPVVLFEDAPGWGATPHAAENLCYPCFLQAYA